MASRIQLNMSWRRPEQIATHDLSVDYNVSHQYDRATALHSPHLSHVFSLYQQCIEFEDGKQRSYGEKRLD